MVARIIGGILLLLGLLTCEDSPLERIPDKVTTFEKVLDINGSAASVVQKKDGGYFICVNSLGSNSGISLIETDPLGTVLNVQKIYDSGYCLNMVENYSGGYYVAVSSNGNVQCSVISIDSLGKSKLINSFPISGFYGLDFCSAKDGGFLVVWSPRDPGPMYWSKYNKEGKLENNESFTYTDRNILFGVKCMQTREGAFIIAARADEIPSTDSRRGCFFLRLYADGKKNAEIRFTPTQHTVFRNVIENRQGDYVWLYGNGDFGVLVSSSSGVIKSQAPTWGTSSSIEGPSQIIVNKDNSGYIGCGTIWNGTDNDAYLFNVDQNGKFIWDKQFNASNSGHQGATDIKLCSDGGYILVGGDNSASPSGKIYLIKTDKNGNVNQ